MSDANVVAVERSRSKSVRYRAALCTLVFLMGPMAAWGADDPEVTLIFNAVRKKYPEWASFCNLDDVQRRQIAVQATIELTISKKVKNPEDSGPLAGNMLRKACGRDTTSPITTDTDAVQIR